MASIRRPLPWTSAPPVVNRLHRLRQRPDVRLRSTGDASSVWRTLRAFRRRQGGNPKPAATSQPSAIPSGESPDSPRQWPAWRRAGVWLRLRRPPLYRRLAVGMAANHVAAHRYSPFPRPKLYKDAKNIPARLNFVRGNSTRKTFLVHVGSSRGRAWRSRRKLDWIVWENPSCDLRHETGPAVKTMAATATPKHEPGRVPGSSRYVSSSVGRRLGPSSCARTSLKCRTQSHHEKT